MQRRSSQTRTRLERRPMEVGGPAEGGFVRTCIRSRHTQTESGGRVAEIRPAWGADLARQRERCDSLHTLQTKGNQTRPQRIQYTSIGSSPASQEMKSVISHHEAANKCISKGPHRPPPGGGGGGGGGRDVRKSAWGKSKFCLLLVALPRRRCHCSLWHSTGFPRAL